MRIALAFLFFSYYRSGQSAVSDADSSRLPPDSLVSMVMIEPEDVTPAEIIDRLQELSREPLDINAAGIEDLLAIPYVSRVEAVNVVAQRRLRGRFASVNDLRALGGDLYQKLAPFVVVTSTVGGVRSSRKRTVEIRLRAGRAYNGSISDAHAEGSPWKLYGRVEVHPAHLIQGGLLFERDAREPGRYAFGSAYIQAQTLGPVSRMILGDFTVEEGEGLVLGKNTGFGRGVDPLAIAKGSRTGSLPYRYTDETRYFRGVAVETEAVWSGRTARALVFYSRRSHAASLGETGEATGFHQSGLFRTETEQSKANNLGECTLGGSVSFGPVPGIAIGVAWYRSVFSPPLSGDGPSDLSGRVVSTGGVNLRIGTGSTAFQGEYARTLGGGAAACVSAVLQAAPGTQVAVGLRRYSPGLLDIHTAGISESGRTSNEAGAYIGVSVRMTPWLKSSGSIDCFRTLWRTKTVPAPTRGVKAILWVDARITKNWHCALRLSQKTTEEKRSHLDLARRETWQLVDRSHSSVRLTMRLPGPHGVVPRARIDYVNVTYTSLSERHEGILLYQDIEYVPVKGLSLSGRVVFYDSGSYAARLYEYERDHSGVATFPLLYGQGLRWYIFLRWIPLPGVRLSAKYWRLDRVSLPGVPEWNQRLLSSGLSFQAEVNR